MKTTALTVPMVSSGTFGLQPSYRAAGAQPYPLKLNRADFSTRIVRTTSGKSDLKTGGSAGYTAGPVNIAF